MEQSAGMMGFREVDQDGNPVGLGDSAAAAEDQPGGRLPAAVNPFIVTLWVLAATLLGGGVWAFLNTSVAIGPSPASMPLSFVVFTFAPYAALSGIIAIIGLLFWHAHQWQRKRTRAL
ncbi:putative uncharacterized protein [Pseudarthrobacter siccitolerans]|uniref:Uncharacterized protein n=1 Tax=Pseudarthrobacter siccitolerans TaxID=861266 RepID=A0A024H7B7_9MICC|nr:hypothetical protein [Pseudarthrobacter siccitolerans]CCQ47792.1 putative uncharacterized protein [Pseudarthrobacter siccitolerans]